MDKKYSGKVVNLPHETHQRLEAYRAKLSVHLGFTPSLSETIAFALKARERDEQAKDCPLTGSGGEE